MSIIKQIERRQPIKDGVAKVPVVIQMESLECGAACLSMILSYYGKWVPLEQVREDCDITRDGAKAGNIARAARGCGLKAQGHRYELDRFFAMATYPCIVHWEFNHFIVVKGVKKNKVYINDPDKGAIVISKKEFDEGFTGICITFERGEDFEPSVNKKSVLSFAAERLEGTGSAVAFVAITTGLISFFSLISTGFSRFFMDYLLPGNNPGLVGGFMLGFILFTVLWVIVAWIQALYSLRISGKFASSGNASYIWHVLRLPMRFFSQRMAGDLEQRRMANATIADLLVNIFGPLIINTIMLILYLAVMWELSVHMTIIGLISVILNVYIALSISRKKVNVTRVMLRDEAKLSAATVSGIEMIETIKASGAENGFFRRWSGYQAAVNTQMTRFAWIDAHLGRIPELVMALVNNIVLIMGVYLMVRGDVSSGIILAFQGLLSQFFKPAQSLIDAGENLQEMRTQMERIEDVMQYPQDPALIETEDEEDADDTEKRLTKLTGELVMKDVTFGYGRLAPPLIENFNLKLESGKSVAIVGASGCGKSTVSKLITGLYQPWSGEILFDGQSISTIDREVFTSSVAVVNQDITLFNDTISNNIRMWDNSIEDFEMILAAHDAHIHDDIIRREGGYNYRMTEGGRDFSGGQRQLLEIARVLAQDPTIVILDEATSALDTRTEYDVVQSVKERGITCIVIAHRLSTVRDCDEIIVLDHGKIAERGDHDELMRADGIYAKLVTSE